MYNEIHKFKGALCEHCGDPASYVRRIQKSYWLYEVINIISCCYECYMELHKGQLPKLTDPSTRSRKGSGIRKKRYD